LRPGRAHHAPSDAGDPHPPGTETMKTRTRANTVRRDARLFRFGDLFPRLMRGVSGALPPGQRAVSSFPRYGAHFARPDPPVPERPMIEVTWVAIETVELDAETLQDFPPVDLTADFHCVAGWTARALHCQGVRFRDIYDR